MPPSPTPNAPTGLEQLKELLKNDTKVKVAGQRFLPASSPFLGFSLTKGYRSGRRRSVKGEVHVKIQILERSKIRRIRLLLSHIRLGLYVPAFVPTLLQLITDSARRDIYRRAPCIEQSERISRSYRQSRPLDV